MLLEATRIEGSCIKWHKSCQQTNTSFLFYSEKNLKYLQITVRSHTIFTHKCLTIQSHFLQLPLRLTPPEPCSVLAVPSAYRHVLSLKPFSWLFLLSGPLFSHIAIWLISSSFSSSCANAFLSHLHCFPLCPRTYSLLIHFYISWIFMFFFWLSILECQLFVGRQLTCFVYWYL